MQNSYALISENIIYSRELKIQNEYLFVLYLHLVIYKYIPIMAIIIILTRCVPDSEIITICLPFL